MSKIFISLRKWLVLILLALCSGAFFYFHLYQYLSPTTLKLYHSSAEYWTKTHHGAAVALYLLLFVGLVACAIPCATFFTLLGGFLFGLIALFYAELATTLGGIILFLAIRTSIGAGIKQRSSGWIKKMEAGFQQNAFHYLLTLRLMPIFPCWLCNISAGALNIRLKTFTIATLIGIFPATVVYVLAGRSLDRLLLNDQNSFSHLMFSPSVFIPLVGLAMLSCFGIIYKHFYQR